MIWWKKIIKQIKYRRLTVDIVPQPCSHWLGCVFRASSWEIDVKEHGGLWRSSRAQTGPEGRGSRWTSENSQVSRHKRSVHLFGAVWHVWRFYWKRVRGVRSQIHPTTIYAACCHGKHRLRSAFLCLFYILVFYSISFAMCLLFSQIILRNCCVDNFICLQVKFT